MVFDRSSDSSVSPRNLAACAALGAIASTAFGLPLAAVRAPRRHSARAAGARRVALYLAHVGLGLTQVATGAGFGRDPSTVRYACRKLEDARDRPGMDRMMDRLEAASRLWIATFLENGECA